MGSFSSTIASALLPPGVGPDAWRSSTFRSAAYFMDACSICFTLVANGLGLLKASRLHLLPPYVYVVPNLLHMSVAILQYAWCKWQPDHYFQHRPFIQLFNRCVRGTITTAARLLPPIQSTGPTAG
jgi:hypothetical protein